MKVNEALWDEVRKKIEYRTEQDQAITDITINFRIKEKSDLRNYLQINLSQYDKDSKTTYIHETESSLLLKMENYILDMEKITGLFLM